MLRVHDRALDVLRSVAPLATAIGRHDPDLAKQLRRALSSVPLGIAEGTDQRGARRVSHYSIALGSAREAWSALRTAAAWGYVPSRRRISRRRSIISSARFTCSRIPHERRAGRGGPLRRTRPRAPVDAPTHAHPERRGASPRLPFPLGARPPMSTSTPTPTPTLPPHPRPRSRARTPARSHARPPTPPSRQTSITGESSWTARPPAISRPAEGPLGSRGRHDFFSREAPALRGRGTPARRPRARHVHERDPSRDALRPCGSPLSPGLAARDRSCPAGRHARPTCVPTSEPAKPTPSWSRPPSCARPRLRSCRAKSKEQGAGVSGAHHESGARWRRRRTRRRTGRASRCSYRRFPSCRSEPPFRRASVDAELRRRPSAVLPSPRPRFCSRIS